MKTIQRDQESPALDDSIVNATNTNVFTESLKSEDCSNSL